MSGVRLKKLDMVSLASEAGFEGGRVWPGSLANYGRGWSLRWRRQGAKLFIAVTIKHRDLAEEAEMTVRAVDRDHALRFLRSAWAAIEVAEVE